MTDTTTQTELEESNRQLIDAWAWFARRAAAGEVAALPGLDIAFSRSPIALLNALFLSSPVVDAADLERRVEAAVAYGDKSGFPWMLTLCEEWLAPAGIDEAARVLSGAGLHPQMRTIGMVADTLEPPRRPTPSLEIRPIDDHEARVAASDLNCAAYDMPLSWGHESFVRESIFGEGAFGCVGHADGAAVSTATTILVEGRRYVALVATAAAHRRRGYAEAVMRRSLEEAQRASGVVRTVLHASEAGFPVYLAMGYRAAATFNSYGKPHG